MIERLVEERANGGEKGYGHVHALNKWCPASR